MLKKLNISIFVVLLTVAPAWAEYINLPIKWSQIPWDPSGVDYLSDHTAGAVGADNGPVVADDFICNEPDPIVAVRWWGSYLDGSTVPRPDGYTGPFDISFHLSVPGGPPPNEHPFSTPGLLVYLATVDAEEDFVGYDSSGMPVYRYDAYIPPFYQYEYSHQSGIPGELWLDIDKPTGEMWGWHEVVGPHPILDYAAVSPGHSGPWTSIYTDMAFELMIIPEPATLAVLLIGAFLGLSRRRR